MREIFFYSLILSTFLSCADKVDYKPPAEKPVDLGLVYDKVWFFSDVKQEAFYTPADKSIPIDNMYYPYPDRDFIFKVGLRFVQENRKLEISYKRDFSFEMGYWEPINKEDIKVTFIRNFQTKDYTGAQREAYDEVLGKFVNKFFLHFTPYTFKIARSEVNKTNFKIKITNTKELPLHLKEIVNKNSTDAQFDYYEYQMFWSLNPSFKP